MLDRIRNEPVLVTNLVSAVVLLVTAFGLDLSSDQVAAVGAVCVAVMAVVARTKVTPV